MEVTDSLTLLHDFFSFSSQQLWPGTELGLCAPHPLWLWPKLGLCAPVAASGAGTARPCPVALDMAGAGAVWVRPEPELCAPLTYGCGQGCVPPAEEVGLSVPPP